MTAYVADQAITTSPTAGLTPAQRMGTLLWLPMLLMGLMVLGGAFGLGIARGAIGADLFETFDASDKATFETLGVLSSGFGLLGVGLLLAAISFALGRLAGVMRKGGASIQEAAGQPVRVSPMAWTAWTFLGLMMMGMMVVIAGFVAQVVAAVSIYDAWIDATGPDGAAVSDLGRAQSITTWSVPVMRAGVALLFTGITFMLATIVHGLREQALRLKQMATLADSSV
ncbi:MAG: hypothetical protein J4N36_01700 [Chloroflexi bacterium]|nr:hypothetical protein [Chloroflexota bacterium]MCI0782948.1 hypothetical protein [Chloroflexota bacterium]MCI0813542.1 hypothetical protein [Chloroflexota bacterium]MCI0817503.1 hypothetical protein [Chloroflexota bacterium]MCI0818680.1 hypothetical protein [Chloroflexota bacterium]